MHIDALGDLLRAPATKTDETLKRGTVTLTPRGFGFVKTEGEVDVFLPPPEARAVLPGDVVEFRVRQGSRPDSTQASIVRVLERQSSVWQGTLQPFDGHVCLRLDAGQSCFATLVLPDVVSCEPDLVVSVRVPGFTGASRKPQGRIKATLERVLGHRGRPGFILDYALAHYDFSLQFSEAALAEAREAAASKAPLTGRLDLQSIPFVTIDGESTKDFDDAVFAEPAPEGWAVHVAIADVSHFVRPGSALEKEALARGTSVYLPGRVVPMLPEALSTSACSLVPGEPRLAVVVRMKVSHTGALLDTDVIRAVIRSAQRLTYNDMQNWQAGTFEADSAVKPSLGTLWALFEALSASRKEAGRLEIETPEPKWQETESGGLLTWTDRTDAHKLVEELMLLTNRAVAQQLANKKGVFRHQPTPEVERWALVRDFAEKQGVALPEVPDLSALARMVGALEGDIAFKAELHARNSMSPAVYSHEQPSHFSLNMAAYTHFTSPIRRAADLLVHRLLLDEAPPEEAALAALAGHCSERSRSARLCERMVWDTLKKSAVIAQVQTGEPQFAGHIVHQSRNGARVVLDNWQTSALITARTLQHQGYSFDLDSEHWGGRDGVLELGTRLPVRIVDQVVEDSKVELLAEPGIASVSA